MHIEKNISLKPYNTFGVEAKASFFTQIENIPQLQQALDFATEHKLPVLALGGGSNILFTRDFDGLAVLLRMKGITETFVDDNHVLVTASAGENWHQFVSSCVEKNYGGLENLSLIPGNVGTAPMQNIGAYGTEIKDAFAHCKVLNTETRELETFTLEDCCFGYRDSFFKKHKGKYIILEVTFRLTTHNHHLNTEYGAIRSELAKMNITEPTIQDIAKAVISIRQSKLPDPKVTGNAGSFFKNPVIPATQFEGLKSKYPDIPGYMQHDAVKIPAGWLIEHSGWKGKQIGNVATHAHQALVIINATGNATGREIYDFSGQIIDTVRHLYGIQLEREVNII